MYESNGLSWWEGGPQLSLYVNQKAYDALPADCKAIPAASHAHVDMQAKYDAKNPAWKKVYEDYAAFRDEQHRWFRFAEVGFDNFMQSGRFAKAAPAPKNK